MKKLKHLTQICEEKYEEGGAGAVIDYINDAQKMGHSHVKDVYWSNCKPCEAEQPHWKNQCLVCGQEEKTDYWERRRKAEELRRMDGDDSILGNPAY